VNIFHKTCGALVNVVHTTCRVSVNIFSKKCGALVNMVHKRQKFLTGYTNISFLTSLFHAAGG